MPAVNKKHIKFKCEGFFSPLINKAKTCWRMAGILHVSFYTKIYVNEFYNKQHGGYIKVAC